jgi:hypothetical protein
MAHLSIRVLGPFQVSFDGEPVSGFASDKVRALLAYLALSPDRPQRREALAGLLWPEFPERSARSSLRNALANLRQVIRDRDTSPPFLLSTRQTIQFNGQSDYWAVGAGNKPGAGPVPRRLYARRRCPFRGMAAAPPRALEPVDGQSLA